MGVVYHARQCSLEREVAIKFIADWFADPDGVARFLAEARAAARLLHPNIVPVHEVGSVEGLHYFSMPLIRGSSLATQLLAGPMRPRDAIALLLVLCDAIDYAHRLGLLHLDLKPANVLRDARGEPQVADFGLARHMDEKGGVDAQEVSGTPSFMAPEQILIKQYRLTPATDLYALGAILYRCLTGVSPHGDGHADDVIRRAASGRIRPPRELDPKIPRDLEAICMKCLELQPSDRYASAARLADDLRHARDGLPVSVRRAGLRERIARWVRREPKFAIALSASALALVLGAATTAWQWREAAAQRDAAKAERDRATIASEIGAHLFAYSGDEDNRADDLIAWLRKRLPGDEPRQADALSTFARTVDASGSTDNAATLVSKVFEVLGVDYRRRMIQALAAGSERDRDLYQALLAWTDESESPDPRVFSSALKAAIAAHPDDPFVWQVAANYCPRTGADVHCLVPDAAEHLVRLDPDNMYAWIVLAATTNDAKRSREALHEAAKRTRFDDYRRATYDTYAKAVQAAAVPVPPLIANPVQVISPGEQPEWGIALDMVLSAPIISWQPLITRCGVRVNLPVVDEQIRSDCLVIGERVMRSEGGLMSRMIAVLIVSAYAKGRPEAEEARRIRRLYTYLDETTGKLAPAERARYTATRRFHDIAEVGEMKGLQRQARFFGFPDQPPPGWKPVDPAALLSARERYDGAVALDQEAGQLVAQGRFADAIEKLAPMDASMRRLFGHGWLFARYLTTLGRAKSGLHDYAAAQAALSDAWEIARNFSPDARDARDCAKAFVELYTAWDDAEKGKGYDIKAGEWKQMLASLAATAGEPVSR